MRLISQRICLGNNCVPNNLPKYYVPRLVYVLGIELRCKVGGHLRNQSLCGNLQQRGEITAEINCGRLAHAGVTSPVNGAVGLNPVHSVYYDNKHARV